MSSTTQTAPSWQRGKVAGWVVSVDHKRIGALYLGWAGVFFVLAGILTILMRLQMTRPNASVLGDGTYQGVLTMHGTLLVFFVLVPVVVGLATYLVPLLIGATRIAMPGLAAAALWLFVFAGAAVVLSAFASGGASKDGWTGYPPGTLTQEGNGARLWLIGLFLLAVSVRAWPLSTSPRRSARCAPTGWSGRARRCSPGRSTCGRGRRSCWRPLAAIGLGLILLERRFSGSFDFFLTSDQHVKPWLIWLFGQSFAYAALVPVFGILAEIVAVFAGRAVANMRTLAQSLVGIGGLTLVLVLYHAYAGGIGKKPSVVLLILAVIATIPSVVALALLKKTLWQARAGLRWTAPLLFAAGADRPVRDRDPLGARARHLRQRAATGAARRSASPTPTTCSGARRCSRCSAASPTGGPRSSAGCSAPAPRRGRRCCSSSASTAPSSSSSCSATTASPQGHRASASTAAPPPTT